MNCCVAFKLFAHRFNIHRDCAGLAESGKTWRIPSRKPRCSNYKHAVSKHCNRNADGGWYGSTRTTRRNFTVQKAQHCRLYIQTQCQHWQALRFASMLWESCVMRSQRWLQTIAAYSFRHMKHFLDLLIFYTPVLKLYALKNDPKLETKQLHRETQDT